MKIREQFKRFKNMETFPQKLKDSIDKSPGDVTINVYPEIIVAVNKPHKMAVIIEMNFEAAYPFDLERAYRNYSQVYSSIGYQFCQVNPDEICRTNEGEKVRKIKLGGKKIKIRQVKRSDYNGYLEDLELILDELPESQQKMYLTQWMAPDMDYSMEEMKMLFDNIPCCVQRMFDLDKEKTNSILLQKQIKLETGQDVSVDSEFINDDIGYMVHIKT